MNRVFFPNLTHFVEVTSFDRCVERSSADTEQVKCLADRVRRLLCAWGLDVSVCALAGVIQMRCPHE